MRTYKLIQSITAKNLKIGDMLHVHYHDEIITIEVSTIFYDLDIPVSCVGRIVGSEKYAAVDLYQCIDHDVTIH